VVAQLRGGQAVEEVGQRFGAEGPLGAAMIEALVDRAEVEAQAAQDVGRLEQNGADFGEAVEAKESFVQQDVAEELGANGAALTGVRELLELLEEAVLVEKVDEAVQKAAGGGQQAIALPPLECGQHRRAVLGHHAPSCPDSTGRHRPRFLSDARRPPI